jgi:hypothetical protein
MDRYQYQHGRDAHDAKAVVREGRYALEDDKPGSQAKAPCRAIPAVSVTALTVLSGPNLGKSVWMKSSSSSQLLIECQEVITQGTTRAIGAASLLLRE